MDSRNGANKDFQWKLTGLQPAKDPNSPESYYGAYVNVSGGENLPDRSTVRFTLAPTGPLIDGSEGKTITQERTAAAMKTTKGPIESTARLADIPIGPYKMTGELALPDGRVTPLSMEAVAVGVAGGVPGNETARDRKSSLNIKFSPAGRGSYAANPLDITIYAQTTGGGKR